MYSIFERLMTEAGETPYQVAKATGVAQSTLSDWKTGKSVPRNPTMKKIADHYGVSVSYLRGENVDQWKKEKPIGREADGLTEEELLRISAAMAQMNKEGRERAVEMVEDLAAGGRFKKPGKDTMGKEA